MLWSVPGAQGLGAGRGVGGKGLLFSLVFMGEMRGHPGISAVGSQPVPVTQCFGPGDTSVTAIPHKTNPTQNPSRSLILASSPAGQTQGTLTLRVPQWGWWGARVSQAWAAQPLGAGPSP